MTTNKLKGTAGRILGNRPSLVMGSYVLAALLLAACQDVVGLGGGGGVLPTTNNKDTVAPVSAVDSGFTGARLEIGDSIGVTASDSGGLAAVALVLAKGNQIVYRSDTLKLKGEKTATKKFAIKNLSSNFPYGEEVKAFGYAIDLAGNAAYSGTATLNVSSAVGPKVVLGRGARLMLATGSFNDWAIDYLNKILYFANPTENSVGFIDLKTFSLGKTDMSPGSRPTNLSIVSQGIFGGSQLVVFAAGSRDFAVFNISNGPQAGSPLLRSDPALADIDTVSAMGTAVSVVRLPSASTSNIFTACAPDKCTLFAGMRGIDGKASVLQTIDLSQANQNPVFDILSPQARFPAKDSSTNSLAGADPEITVRALAVDPNTGQRNQLFFRNGRSVCGTLYGDTIVSGIRPDGQGFIYVKTRKSESSCKLGLIRLDPGATGREVSTAAAVQVIREPRYTDIEDILVSPAGTRVVVRTKTQILVADPDLRVRGELPAGVSPAGAGLLIGSPDITDGQWVAVAFGDKVVIYDSNTFRPLAQFPTAVPLVGKLIFLPLTTGEMGRVLILGFDAKRTSIVKIETSIAEIKAGAGL